MPIYENQLVKLFCNGTIADVSCGLRKAEIATLAAFL
jgi:hypothetical protein